MPLLFLFILVPATEIYVMMKVGNIIGAFPTFLMIIGTAVIGYQLFRAQGIGKLNSLRSAMAGQAGRENMAMDMAEGAAILLAGALLLVPGFVTDIIGFACLIPPVRKLMLRNIIAKGAMRAGQSAGYSTYTDSTANAEPQKPSNIIEGEYKEK